MATWLPQNFRLTNRGVEILSKVAGGVGALTVSKIGAGSGYTSPANLAALTAVNSEKQTMALVKVLSDVNSTELNVRLTNDGLEAPYDLYQIGVYVTHPDYAGHQLYMIAQCESGTGDTIPLPSVNPVTLNFSLKMVHEGVSSISVTVSPAGMVSALDFEAFQSSVNTGKANTIHTHNADDVTSGTLSIERGGTGQTTAAAVRNALGLGNTTNALPVANGGTGAVNAADARTNLEITVANLGAAPAEHYHAFSEITGEISNSAGTLSIAKGGTGAITAEAARTALGINLTNLGAAATSHTHAPSDLTSAVPITKGGTGQTTAADARTALDITPANIGAAASAHNHAPTDLTSAVTIDKGGTGSTTAEAARTALGVTLANLGAAASVHTHLASDITTVVPITGGGTGQTSAAAARNALGLGNSTGALAIENGGTGATTLENAKTALGISVSGIGAAPASHASTANTYGLASATNYGHAKASSSNPLVAGTMAVGTDDGTFARGNHVHPAQTSVSGNAGTATKLASPRKINGTDFDGSKDISFGALSPTVIESSTDLNTLNNPGFYACVTSVIAGSLVNCPTLEEFFLIVGKHSGHTQMLIEGASAKVYFRTYTSSWSAWARIYSTLDKPTSVSGNAGTATKLSTKREISITGVTSTPADFDGSGNIALAVTAVPASLITGSVPVANGGTGSTTAEAARTALGVPPTTHASSNSATYGVASATNYGHAKASSSNPLVAGTTAVGTDDGTFARGNHVHPAQTSVSGNAGTATKLKSEVDLSISGGATAAATAFDGSKSITLNVTALDMTKATNTLPIANGGTGQTTAAGIRNALGLGETTNALPIANGGTGQTTVSAARNALGLGNTDGALPVANGGTGSTNAGNARTALGVPPTSHASSADTYGKASNSVYGHAKATSTAPAGAGTANVGTDDGLYARGDHVHPAQTSVSGNAGTATKLSNERSFSISGGATGTGTAFDGSKDIAIPVTALNAGYITTGTVPLANGGTGSSTAADARTALGITPANIGAATSAHTHGTGDITGTLAITGGGTGATTAEAARTALGITLANLGAAASTHYHLAGDITSGVLAIDRGGTGSSTAEAARTALGITLANLGGAAATHYHGAGDITSGTLPIARGGTGASTAADAAAALGVLPSTTAPSNDCNEVIISGRFRSSAWINKPSDTWDTQGILEVIRYASDYLRQIFYSPHDLQEWTRRLHDGVWGDWIYMKTTTGRIDIAGGGTGAATKKAAKTNLGITFQASGTPSGGSDGDIVLIPI